MKLISMTDFVLDKQRFKEDSDTAIFKITNYANFLKQPLKLEVFVPVDEEGNLLEEPEQFKEWIKSDHYFNASESVTHQCRMYKKSKEKVLFEEKINMPKNIKEFMNWIDYNKLNIIEDIIDYNLTLTPDAIKQLAL